MSETTGSAPPTSRRKRGDEPFTTCGACGHTERTERFRAVGRPGRMKCPQCGGGNGDGGTVRFVTALAGKAGVVGESEPHQAADAAPAGEAARPELRWVPLDRLVPTADNPRRDVDQPAQALRELVHSVRQVGILQPLIARPHPDGSGRLDLRAGHRRLRAARLAGLDSVPVIVREMDDTTAKIVTVTENKDREDLTPLEEARAVQLLLSAGLDVSAAADKLGRSAAWVARRAQLTTLTPAWVAVIQDEKHPAAKWSALQLEQIARLPAVTQDQVLGDWADRPSIFKDFETADDLAATLSYDYLHELAEAPFRTDDGERYKGLPACVACPKRSSAEPLLWDDAPKARPGKLAKHDRCLDARCWARKTELERELGYAEARQREEIKGRPLPVVVRSYIPEEQAAAKALKAPVIDKSQAFDAQPEQGGNFQPAYDLASNRVVYVRPHARAAPGAAWKPERSATETLELRRKAHVLGAIGAMLDKAAASPPAKPPRGIPDADRYNLVAMALLFLNPGQRSAKIDSGVLRGRVTLEQQRLLLAELVTRLRWQLNVHGLVAAGERWPLVKSVCEVFDQDPAALWAEAVKAFPGAEAPKAAAKAKRKARRA